MLAFVSSWAALDPLGEPGLAAGNCRGVHSSRGAACHYLCHPDYVSFLGLIWFNPSLTLDRLVLAVTWTAYLFYGSDLKDRRMVHDLSELYGRDQARVPGNPFIPFGPLSKLSPAHRDI